MNCAGVFISEMGLSLRLPVDGIMTQRLIVFIINLVTEAEQILSYSNLTILVWPVSCHVASYLSQS